MNPEADKLYTVLLKYSCPEMASHIAYGVDLPTNANEYQKADWVAHVTTELEKFFHEGDIKSIRQCNHCRIGLDDWKTSIGDLYRQSATINEFLQRMNQQGVGWHLRNGQLYTSYHSCSCPMLQGTKRLTSKTWCYCASGFCQEMFEEIFSVPVEIEVLETIKMGYPRCLIRVSKKAGKFA